MAETTPLRFAIFDVDHTITRSSTGRRLVQCGKKAGLFTFRDLLRVPYYYIKYRKGSLKVDVLARSLAALEGRRQESLRELAHNCYRSRVREDIFPQARRRIEEHRAAGHTVVIASSSLWIIIEPLAEELGIEHVVCTRLEFRDGVATGRLEAPPCFGEGKLEATRALLTSLGGTVEEAAFYSDSHHDVPLLSACGRPIVVNPDKRLEAQARAHGWETLEFGRRST